MITIGHALTSLRKYYNHDYGKIIINKDQDYSDFD